MGRQNLSPGQTAQKVLKGRCIICHTPDFIEYCDDLGSATFDYTCKACNENVRIRITDIVLRSTRVLTRLDNDVRARKNLMLEVSKTLSAEFPISMETLYKAMEYSTGEECPVSGLWAFDPGGFATQRIKAGALMPTVNGASVQWRLIESG